MIETVEVGMKSFAKEFTSENKHISYYHNNEFSFVLYYYDMFFCIDELNITITKMDLDDCYERVKNNFSYTDNNTIIIALAERKNERGESIATFYFYDTVTKEMVNVNEICRESKVTTSKSVEEQMDNSEKDYDSMKHLTDQNIDIFNLDSKFYTNVLILNDYFLL